MRERVKGREKRGLKRKSGERGIETEWVRGRS